MIEQLRLAVAQLRSSDRLDENETRIQKHLELVEQLGGADVISFPENALYMRISPARPIEFLSLDAPVFKRWSAWSQRSGIAIHLGSTPLKINRKNYNATVLLLPDGSIESPYQKIHLFDVDLENQRAIRESDTFAHGTQPFIWNYKGWKFGLSICYDLRFGELYRIYRDGQVDCILVPSAFTVPTGEAHWEVLMRARAIETQAYVAAAAQEGEHQGLDGETRSTYGHSMIINPWGQVIAEAKPGPELLFTTLNRGEIQRARRQIPLLNHVRLGQNHGHE